MFDTNLMQDMINSLFKWCNSITQPPPNILTQIYAICHIDFTGHYNKFKHLPQEPYLVSQVLTHNQPIATLWHTLLTEITQMFQYLLTNPRVVHHNTEIINVMVTNNIVQYIMTMLLIIKQSIPQISESSILLIKRQLFEPVYIYIHQFNVLVETRISIDIFYSCQGETLLQTRYPLTPEMFNLIKVNTFDVIVTLQAIGVDVCPHDKLLKIQTTIDILNKLFVVVNQVCTTDLLLAALATVIHFAKIPFLIVELKFCKDFFETTYHPSSQLQFCFTSFEAIVIDILLQYAS